MQTSEIDLAKILVAIELMRERTGTEIVMASNEKVRDGSRILLKSPEGWYIDVLGAKLYEDHAFPVLGVRLRGYVYNPKTDILEALTLHPVEARDSVAELEIDDPKFDFVTYVVSNLVPAVRHSAKLLFDAWTVENERKALTEQLQAHFKMDGAKKRFTRGPHTVDISVGPSSANFEHIGMCLRADGLSTTQLEAILKILDESPAAPTAPAAS